MTHDPWLPEPLNRDTPSYAPGHWDYPARCADLEHALNVARERIEEWSEEDDPHGYWHDRPVLIALYNEVVR